MNYKLYLIVVHVNRPMNFYKLDQLYLHPVNANIGVCGMRDHDPMITKHLPDDLSKPFSSVLYVTDSQRLEETRLTRPINEAK